MNKVMLVGAISAFYAMNTSAELTLDTYNPGNKGIFPVSSTLIMGKNNAILVDAQFSIKDGNKLVKMIKDSKKKLSTIYISSGDPDYYFGLQPLVRAYPDVEIIASQNVVKHIQKTKDDKLKYWGPKLKDGAPTHIIVPKVSNQTSLSLDGEEIHIKEINTHQAYLWIPSTKTVLGGVAVTSGMHVWTADSQTSKARAEWVTALDKMKGLRPNQVIPGHYHGEIPSGTDAIQFTKSYLQTFEIALSHSYNSVQVINKMLQQYPSLEGKDDLELSAQVNMGELEW